MMLFYIIPFEKRFCSYLKLLRRGGCGGAGTQTRASKHTWLPRLVIPSVCLLCGVNMEGCILSVYNPDPLKRCLLHAQASERSVEDFT